MRIFAVGTKIFGGLANIGGGAMPPGPNVEPPLAVSLLFTCRFFTPFHCVSKNRIPYSFATNSSEAAVILVIFDRKVIPSQNLTKIGTS